MTTFLLFICSLLGSRYFLKYLYSSNKVDSKSLNTKQDNNSNVVEENFNNYSSVRQTTLSSPRNVSKHNSLKTIYQTESVTRTVPKSFGKTTTQSYDNFSNSAEYVYVPELSRLQIFPSKTKIKSGETIQFNITGLDESDNQIAIKERISWSTTAGEINSTGLFLIDSIDDVLVKISAKIGEIETAATVNVESIYELLYEPPKSAQLKSLKVIPDCVYLKPKEEKIFEVLGFDQHKNQIDCGEIIWSAMGGTIDQNGKLIVDNNAKGIYQVTATSKNAAKYGTAAKTTLLTLGVSTRVLSWAVANEEFFYDLLAPVLNLTNDDESLSEADELVQGWIVEIGRRRIAKLLKKASDLSFKEAFSNLSDSIDYIVLPELRKIEFVNPPSKVKQGDRIQLKVIELDQALDRINVDNQIIWTANSGLIDSQGVFVADSNASSVNIIVKVKDKNIETKIEIKIKPSFEEYCAAKTKVETLNKSSNLREAIFSKVTEIVSNKNLYAEDNVTENSEIPKTAFSPADQTTTNNANGNGNLASENLFALPDNLPSPEAPYYSTRNHVSLSVPSWFYRSQAFHDGFSAGDFTYDDYLEYMSDKDYYSYSK